MPSPFGRLVLIVNPRAGRGEVAREMPELERRIIAGRLEQRGWIDTDWRMTENSRRAKYYRLTAAGRRALGQELASWNRFVSAVGLVLAAES